MEQRRQRATAIQWTLPASFTWRVGLLRSETTRGLRLQQAALAREYGIFGFCYYHYWFNGRRLLNRPMDEVLATREPDFPFCLCWANENWTRAWDGSKSNIIVQQHYSEEDDLQHARFLLRFFTDDRYVRVQGKPVFIIYRPDILPDVQSTISTFRNVAADLNLDLYLCAFERHIGLTAPEIIAAGFDAAIEFAPLSRSFAEFDRLNQEEFH